MFRLAMPFYARPPPTPARVGKIGNCLQEFLVSTIHTHRIGFPISCLLSHGNVDPSDESIQEWVMMASGNVQLEWLLQVPTARCFDHIVVEQSAIVVGQGSTVEQGSMRLLLLVHLSSRN